MLKTIAHYIHNEIILQDHTYSTHTHSMKIKVQGKKRKEKYKEGQSLLDILNKNVGKRYVCH